MHHRALGGADTGDIVVVGQGGGDVGGGQLVRRQLDRVEPGAQGEILGAEQFRRLHAGNGLQFRLHDADQIIGDLVRLQNVGTEAHIHGVDGLADRHLQYRLLRARRQLVQHRIDLGVDFGQRLVAVIVQAEIAGDGRERVLAGRLHVIDAVGLGDRVLERRGDEAGDDVRIGAEERGGDGHHRILGARILQDRQGEARLDAQHQDEQAHHGREDRPADEQICKLHLCMPSSAGRAFHALGFRAKLCCLCIRSCRQRGAALRPG